MKLTYRASLDELVAKQEYSQSAKTGSQQNLYYVLFGMNLLVAPAFLIFADKFVIALAVFIINLFLYFFLLNSQRKINKKYYAACFPNLESSDTSVEINTNGISCTYEGSLTFVPWQNISEISESGADVTFEITSGSMFVPRRAFDSDEHFVAFVNEARAFKERSATDPDVKR